MSLSSRMKNRLIDAINVAFAGIGHSAGMNMPKSTSNHAPIVWEYAVAKHLTSLAKKREDKAKQACIEAGVLISKDEPGKYGIIYGGDVVCIDLEVRSAGRRLKQDDFKAYLQGKGVKKAVIDEAYEAASWQPELPHVYTTHWVTNDDSATK